MNQDGEIGRFGSQHFLEIVKFGSRSESSAKKGNKYIEDFSQIIDAQGKDLYREINRQKAHSSSRDIEFHNYFSEALSPILRDYTTTQALEEQSRTNSARFCKPLHQRSTEILTGAAALIEQLRKTCEALQPYQASSRIDLDWQNDMYKMKSIIDSERQICEQKVESIFTGNRNPILGVQTAEMLHDKSGRIAREPTWDQVLRKQEKALMRLLDTLPWSEG